MFAEEEWTEALPSHEQAHDEFKSKPLGGKQSKDISKRCLKRTLQTLGSVPDWSSTQPAEESEGEAEDRVRADKKKKKKKKRKRKWKKTSEGECKAEQQETTEVPERPKKKKPKKIFQKTSCGTASEAVTDEDSKGQKKQKCTIQTEENGEERQSRQQWKNKMKNKRRCKNKFLQNSIKVSKIHLKDENSEETKAMSETVKGEEHCSSQGSAKKAKKIEVAPLNTDTSTKINTTTDIESEGTNSFKPRAGESVGKTPKMKNIGIQKQPNPTNLAEKHKKIKLDQKAKKLRHVLKLQDDESSNNLEAKENSKSEESTPVITEDKRSPLDRSSVLRSRMEKQLESARFRYINEMLYTSASGEAKRMFKQDPSAIQIYHRGYTEQVKRWPTNPVDSIIAFIKQKPSSLVVADFGCGDCKIARSVKNKVHCFDLAPVCNLVTACDMSKVPLADSSVDIAVFCLSLMGTNLTDFLAEANRVLMMGGILKIAEVASRFENMRQFLGALSSLGFKVVNTDTDNSHFYTFEFVKTKNAPGQAKKINLELKSCLYKKR